MALEVSTASSRHLTSPAPDQLQPGPWLSQHCAGPVPRGSRGLIPLALCHIMQILFLFYLLFYSRKLGAQKKFNFCQPWQAQSLLAQSSVAAFGAWNAALADHCTPGTSWAHSFRDFCPLRPFPCLLSLPVLAWSLLRIRNKVIYLRRAQPNIQARSRAKLKLKNSLRWSALFPC